MADRKNDEAVHTSEEIFLRSNPGLLKIDVTNPREWYKNGEKILTSVMDRNNQRHDRSLSIADGSKMNGTVFPCVFERRLDRSPDRNPKKEKAKAFHLLSHLESSRDDSHLEMQHPDGDGSPRVRKETETGKNSTSNAAEATNVNGLPPLKNGDASNGVSESEPEGVRCYKTRPDLKYGDLLRNGRPSSPKSFKRSKHLKQRSILLDTINFEQYKLRQKSMFKLRYSEPDIYRRDKHRSRNYLYHLAPTEKEYAHAQSKLGPIARPKYPQKSAAKENRQPETEPQYADDGLILDAQCVSPTIKYGKMDGITNGDMHVPSTSPNYVKEGRYVYKAPGDGYYQRSVTREGQRAAVVNLDLNDVSLLPSEVTTPSLRGRGRRKPDSGYTSSVITATEMSLWDDRSLADYETDDELRGRVVSRGNGASTVSRAASTRSACSTKTGVSTKGVEDYKDVGNGNKEESEEHRIDSPSKKSVRFYSTDANADGAVSPAKSVKSIGRPKSVLKKFNKIEVFGEYKEKKFKKAEDDKAVSVVQDKRKSPSLNRAPVYRLDPKQATPEPATSVSEKVTAKSAEDEDEFMTRIARQGSPTEKMVEIVESYRKYLEQADYDDPTPRTKEASSKEEDKPIIDSRGGVDQEVQGTSRKIAVGTVSTPRATQTETKKETASARGEGEATVQDTSHELHESLEECNDTIQDEQHQSRVDEEEQTSTTNQEGEKSVQEVNSANVNKGMGRGGVGSQANPGLIGENGSDETKDSVDQSEPSVNDSGDPDQEQSQEETAETYDIGETGEKVQSHQTNQIFIGADGSKVETADSASENGSENQVSENHNEGFGDKQNGNTNLQNEIQIMNSE